MSKKILITPGDGIGQEVTSSAREVLDFLIGEHELDFDITQMDVGGTSYDKNGSPLPKEVLDEARRSDAILFGAVGGPQWDDLGWDSRPEQALLGLRKELELFANLRPAFLFNELAGASPIKDEIIKDLDILIVRELTGGIYFGEPRAIVSDESPPYAFNTMIYNEDEIKRIAKVAFESARKRGGKLCSVEKANVLEVSKFWRSVVSDMAKDYPDVELSHQLADNTAMQLVMNPNQFDVIVSSNLFGDILSDLGPAVTGTIAIAPGGNINPEKNYPSMFEPVHGSAPDIHGQLISNPIGEIWSAGMMLDHLGESEAASAIETAIETVLRDSDVKTPDMGGEASTVELGDAIARAVAG